MPSNDFDNRMPNGVRFAMADCEEVTPLSTLGWAMTVGGAIVHPPIVYCPAWSLEHHGHIRMVYTGPYTGTAGAGNNLRVRPEMDGGLATGATNMTFSAIPTVTGPANFVLTVDVYVVGDTSGRASQVWVARLLVVDTGGVVKLDSTLACNSTIDYTVEHDIGIGLSIPAGDASMATTKIVSCFGHHYAQRSGT